MAEITAQVVTVDGLAIIFEAAASGDTASCGAGYTLHVRNGDSSSHDVTIAVPGTLATGDAYPDKTYSIAAGAQVAIPILAVYKDPSDGLAHLTWSATTSMTRALVKT
jgi:hypothetical protein